MAEQLSEKDEIRIMDEIRDIVRTDYAAAAKAASAGSAGSCGPQGCGCGETVLGEEEREVYGAALYEDGEREALPDAAKLASLGCGNSTSARAVGSTSCSRRGAWARAERPTGST
jgi:hypothetical protein